MWAPGAILGGIDSLIEILAKIIEKQKKLKGSNQQNLLRNSLRVVEAMTRMPEIETNNKFQEFFKDTIQDEQCKQIIESKFRI